MPRGGSETILLVDDDELIRQLGSRILQRGGYAVIEASNGKEALDVYRSRGKEISLVVLDLIMPEMGGVECLQELLKIGLDVKVVIASGFSAEKHTRDLLHSGAKGFVNKPFNMKDVLETVRNVLDG
ncbi:MAG: response regulator [Thermodesulfobacteriota bacterium]